MNRRISATLLVVAALAAPTIAETHIAGDIHAMSLDETGNPYIVEQDVFVPAGKKATIKEGCIFLFKGFTGLRVEGQLSVEGTTAKPVIFTSVNDNDHNPASEQLPNSFDWNGVLITREAAGASFKAFQLRYSVYGIKAQNANIQIEYGLFYQNGQFHFTINDKIQFVQDNQPFTYNPNGTTASSTTTPDKKGPAKAARAAKPAGAEPSTTKKVVRFSCLGVGVVGIGVGVGCTVAMVGAQAKVDNWSLTKNPDKTDYDAAVNLYLGTRAGTIIGYAVGAACLTGFGLTFVF